VPKHRAHHASTRVRKAALTRRERVTHTPRPNARAARWPSSKPRRGTRGGRAHVGRARRAPWVGADAPRRAAAAAAQGGAERGGAGSCATGEATRARRAEAGLRAAAGEVGPGGRMLGPGAGAGEGRCWGRASVRRRSHTKKQLRLKSSPRDGRRSLFMELRRFKPT
jgi:hypothetical protein